MRWDTANPLTGPNGGNWTGYDHSSYGLCIDSQGNVFNTEYGPLVRKFSPLGTLLATFNHGTGSAQGCVVGSDDDLWVAGSLSGNTVDHLKNDGTFVGSVTVGSGPTGVAVDNNGKIWVTNHYSQTVMRIDPTAGPIGADGVTPVGAVDFTTPDLGGYLYNYSDMTGSTLSGQADNGNWTVVRDSTVDGYNWSDISWTANVPGDAVLAATVQVSNNGTDWSAPQAVSNGQSLAGFNGQYLKVVVSFTRSSAGQSPILYDLTLDSTCGLPDQPSSNGGSSGSGGPTSGGGSPTSTPAPEPETTVLGFETILPELTKTVNIDQTNPGTTITYTVLVKNSGTVELTGVEVVDVLPDGFVFSDDKSSTKTWVIGTLAAGNQQLFTYQVDVLADTPAGVFNNSVQMVSNEYDPLTVTTPVEVTPVRVAGYELLPESGGPIASLPGLFGTFLTLLGWGLIRRYTANE